MKRINLGMLLLPLFLVGCNDSDADAEQKAASNPLAEEQQAIQDARAVEDLLDKDADEKKKAIDDLN